MNWLDFGIDINKIQVHFKVNVANKLVIRKTRNIGVMKWRRMQVQTFI